MQKLKILALVLFFALGISAYFIFSFLLVIEVDNSMSASIQEYSAVVDRNPELSTLLVYFTESVSRNETLYGSFSDGPAVTSLINTTLTKEQNYNLLRKNLPSTFEQAASFIMLIEGPNLCAQLASNSQTILDCETSLSGQLLQGLTSTINQALNQIIQLDINFNNARSDEEQIKEIARKAEIQQLVLVKLMFMDQLMEELMLKVGNSILDYLSYLESFLVLCFTVFILIMIVFTCLGSTAGIQVLNKEFSTTKSILNLIPGKSLIDLGDLWELRSIKF